MSSRRILSLTLIVGEPKALALEANYVLDVFDLALEELSALLQLVWVAFQACNLLVYLGDASYDQHLELLQDRLETLRKRGQVEEEVVLSV